MLLRTLYTLIVVSLLNGCSAPLLLGAAAVTAGGVMVADDKRTTGSFIDDQTLKVRVAKALATDSVVKPKSHINIHSYNAAILLTGEVASEEGRQRATEVASSQKEVKSVINELTINQPSSFTSRTSDTWITTKVKSHLLTSDGVKSGRIKVTTERGVVYLMGQVTREEGKQSAHIAAQVDGVLKVVKIFQYIK